MVQSTGLLRKVIDKRKHAQWGMIKHPGASKSRSGHLLGLKGKMRESWTMKVATASFAEEHSLSAVFQQGGSREINTLTSFPKYPEISCQWMAPLRQVCLEAWGHGSQFVPFVEVSLLGHREDSKGGRSAESGSWRTNMNYPVFGASLLSSKSIFNNILINKYVCEYVCVCTVYV